MQIPNRLNFPCPPSTVTSLKMAVIQDGIELCCELSKALKPLGLFPALTGGLIYKGGKRKDIDIVIYRHRQFHAVMPELDEPIIKQALIKSGVEINAFYGFCTKAKWNGFVVDLFNPESTAGDDYAED